LVKRCQSPWRFLSGRRLPLLLGNLGSLEVAGPALHPLGLRRGLQVRRLTPQPPEASLTIFHNDSPGPDKLDPFKPVRCLPKEDNMKNPSLAATHRLSRVHVS